MKTRIGRLVLGLAALLALSSAYAQDSETAAYLETVRVKYGLPAVAAAVAKNGEVVAIAAVGTRVHDRALPVSVNDRFHIGSDTKAMTATLAGMMVDEGKLRWNSTIGEVLGEDIEGLNPTLAAVTLEQLLAHSSGIPSDNEEMLDIFFNDDAFDFNLVDLRRKALESWKGNEPFVPEGSPFQYANFGFMIVGMMIETVAEKPWEALIHERIFAPLGLKTAGLGPQATIGLIDAPVGHRIGEDGKIIAMLWGPAADVPPIIGPAGNAHMSIEDFVEWAAWNAGEGKRGPVLVSPETLRTIHAVHVQTPHRANPPPGTPEDGGYGFGWGIIEYDWAGKPLLSHNGSNSMNLAKILVDTENDLGIVVATNFPGADAEAAASEVQEHLYLKFGPSR